MSNPHQLILFIPMSYEHLFHTDCNTLKLNFTRIIEDELYGWVFYYIKYSFNTCYVCITIWNVNGNYWVIIFISNKTGIYSFLYINNLLKPSILRDLELLIVVISNIHHKEYTRIHGLLQIRKMYVLRYYIYDSID